MKIGIIGAMDSEVDGLKHQLEDYTVESISTVDFFSGKLCGVEVIVAKAGVGKVNAAICAQTMILAYRPDTIINIGVSGGYHSLNIGDVVVANAVVEHDMDTSPLGDPKGYISGLNLVQMPANSHLSQQLISAAERVGVHCKSGLIASGDQFINSNSKVEELYREFHAIAYEMEGASIGHVCTQNKLPFAVLRAISDNGDDNSNIDFPTFVQMAAERSISIILGFLTALSKAH